VARLVAANNTLNMDCNVARLVAANNTRDLAEARD